MNTPCHHAPDANRMQWACEHALEHYRRADRPGAISTISVDPVPHLMPGMGISGEWYQVGAIHEVDVDRFLSVYLDAVSGDILLEQPKQAVMSDAQIAAMSSGRMVFIHQERDAAERERWENEGGRVRDSRSRLLTFPRRRPSQHGDAH
jgi:hypothetical protein